MSNRILNMIDEIKRIEASAPVVNALTRPAPLARKLPTATSIFGKTSELQAVISEIRAIEAHNPSVAKFTAPVVVGNFCNKKDLLAAKTHLQQLKAAKPAATVRKPIAAPKITATNGKQIVTREQFRKMTPQQKMATATNPQIKIID